MSNHDETLAVLLEKAAKQDEVNLQLRKSLDQTVMAINGLSLVLDATIKALKENDIEINIPEQFRTSEED